MAFACLASGKASISLELAEDFDDGVPSPSAPAKGSPGLCRAPLGAPVAPLRDTEVWVVDDAADSDECSSVQGPANERGALASGVLPAAGDGGPQVAWAVLPPRRAAQSLYDGEGCAQARKRRPSAAEGQAAGDAGAAGAVEVSGHGERALKRLKAWGRGQPPLPATGSAASAREPQGVGGSGSAALGELAPSLALRAEELLHSALGGSEEAREAASCLVGVFLRAHGRAARQLLLALGAALRKNQVLRDSVLQRGAETVALELVAQDPRQWASETLQERRRQWSKEAMREVSTPVSQVAACPACGGRAFVNCGSQGSGRSGRLTKQFAHYTCTEERCGKATHIKEG